MAPKTEPSTDYCCLLHVATKKFSHFANFKLLKRTNYTEIYDRHQNIKQYAIIAMPQNCKYP